MTNLWRRVLAALTHTGPGYDLSDPDLHAVFAALADRYEYLATTAGIYIGPARAAHITQAVADIRHVLATGRTPAYLHDPAKFATAGQNTNVEEDAS